MPPRTRRRVEATRAAGEEDCRRGTRVVQAMVRQDCTQERRKGGNLVGSVRHWVRARGECVGGGDGWMRGGTRLGR